MKRLLNPYEKATHETLVKSCSRNGATVYCKVRVADVLEIEDSGIPSDWFTFALKAHFDFVVADKDDMPLFAVEFDGNRHEGIEQLRRDRIKNKLCGKLGLPILRINCHYIEERYRTYDLLTWCVDVWFLRKAFDEAQESGAIPLDEVFDPAMFLYTEAGRGRFPLWLSVEVASALWELHRMGLITQPVPGHVIGEDEEGNLHGLAWLAIAKDRGIIIRSGMRNQLFPIDSYELLDELMMFAMHKNVMEVLEGVMSPVQRTEIDRRVNEFKAKFRFVHGGGMAWPDAGAPGTKGANM